MPPVHTEEPRQEAVARGNFFCNDVMRSATKMPNRVGLSLLPSGRPRRISTEWRSCMPGCRTLMETEWKRARKCIHIFPTMPRSEREASSFSRCTDGKAVE